MLIMSRIRRLRRTGPVSIGIARDSRTGRNGVVAACTNDDCGWSANFATQEAAELAAQDHRCSVR
ncbi:Mobile element transfer [Streptomyces sp. JH002]|uniref:mobile element transfer protein n=1 Tax=Streptomyces sp. JH002 TaxID=2763259 RepID=UPI003D807603